MERLQVPPILVWFNTEKTALVGRVHKIEAAILSEASNILLNFETVTSNNLKVFVAIQEVHNLSFPREVDPGAA